MENQHNSGLSKSPTPTNIAYLKCPKKEHKNMELKFILENQMPEPQDLYCRMCLDEKRPEFNKEVPEIVNIQSIFNQIVTASKKLSDEINPVIDEFQKKQEQISKNDFKVMFEHLILKREEFRKITSKFRKDVDLICTDIEKVFDKRLESLFYQSLIAIESKLSSFKQTFEILRMKLNTYNQELSNYFSSSESIDQYKHNVSVVLKDLHTIKDSRLIKSMTKNIRSANTNSHMAERFFNNKDLETELSKLTESLTAQMVDKYKQLEAGMNMEFINRIPKVTEQIQQIQGDKENIAKIINDSGPKKSLTEPLLSKENLIDSSHKPKNTIKEHQPEIAPLRLEDHPKHVWADPADESIEIFEKEISKFYEQELIQNNFKNEYKLTDFSNLRLNTQYEKIVKKETEKLEKVEKERAQKQETEDEKLKKYAVSLASKFHNKLKDEENSDGEYVSEDENDEKHIDELALEREIRRHFHSKVASEPRIFKRIMKSKKPNQKTKSKEIESEIAKFSRLLMDKNHKKKINSSQEEDENNILIVLNNGKVAATDQREFQRAFQEQLMQYLSIRDPGDDLLEKVDEAAKKIDVTYHNRRVSVETIVQIEEMVGEYLRADFSKEILKYRNERRRLWDREVANSYEDVCREFLFRYYNHFKAIKAALLKKLSITKELFNESKKIWIEKGQTDLLWYTFKAKSQKIPVVQYRAINEDDLGEILEEVASLMKETLEKYMNQFQDKTKREKHYFYEIVSARIFDQIYKNFQVEEEDILYSLTAFDDITNEENLRLYEEIENTVAKLVFPETKIILRTDD